MESEMVRVVARLVAKEGQEEALGAELVGLLEPTRAEPGCVRYELWRNAADPREFTFVEEWASGEALEGHFETPHVRGALARFPDLLDGELDLRQYDVMG